MFRFDCHWFIPYFRRLVFLLLYSWFVLLLLLGCFLFLLLLHVMSWFCRFLSHSIIVTTFLFCCRCFNIFSRFLVLISYNNFKWGFRRMLLFIYVSFYAVMCSVVILVISHIRNLLNKYLYISYSYYLSSHTV